MAIGDVYARIVRSDGQKLTLDLGFVADSGVVYESGVLEALPNDGADLLGGHGRHDVLHEDLKSSRKKN